MIFRFSWIYLGVLLAAQAQELPLQEAWAKPELELALTSHGPAALELSKANSAPAIGIPAGTICVTDDGQSRGLVLKTAVAKDPRTTFPVASLSGSLPEGAKWRPVDALPELAPLTQYLATQPAASPEALRLTALCLLNNPTFRQWNTLSTETREAKVTAALDAVTLLREIAPGKAFVLQSDPDLKLAAFHTPGLRGKAMQVFQVNITPVPVDPKSLPTMGQLLHLAPGDNCPLCRVRGKAAGAQDNL